MIKLLSCTANKQQASSQRLYYIFWYVSYVYCSEVSGVLYVRLAKGAITVYCIRADGEVSVISRLINYTWELNVAQAYMFTLAGGTLDAILQRSRASLQVVCRDTACVIRFMVMLW